MNRQAVLSMPLSFAIVLVAAIALGGPGRVVLGPEGGVPGSGPSITGTDGARIGPRSVEISARGGDRLDESGRRADADPPTAVASEPGETLADVAARVFGTRDMVGPLLDANAGAVGDDWRPLPAGTLLRLP